MKRTCEDCLYRGRYLGHLKRSMKSSDDWYECIYFHKPVRIKIKRVCKAWKDVWENHQPLSPIGRMF